MWKVKIFLSLRRILALHVPRIRRALCIQLGRIPFYVNIYITLPAYVAHPVSKAAHLYELIQELILWYPASSVYKTHSLILQQLY